jgi:hypothetical protein
MTAPHILDARAREAIALAIDFIREHHPAPGASDQLTHLLTLESALGASLHEAPAYATTLALSALCDIVEEQNRRIAQLEARIAQLEALQGA